MNLDHPNKNERQMKEAVHKYKAPFDPNAWKDMKSKLADSPKHPNTGGPGNAKSDSSSSTFFNFKNLLLMTLIFVFFTALFWNVSTITPNTNTTELNDRSTILAKNDKGNNDLTSLNIDRNTTAANETNGTNETNGANGANETNVTNEDISNNELTANVVNLNTTNLADGNKTPEGKTPKSTLNQNNAYDRSKEKSSTKNSNYLTDNGNINKLPLPINQANVIATSTRSTNIENQTRGNIANQNISTTTTAGDKKTDGLNSSSLNIVNGLKPKTASPKATRSKLNLLPMQFSFTSNKIEELDLLSIANDPFKKVKMKRFSIGVFGGTSYSMFSKPNSFNIVGGIMAKFKITKQLSIQADGSWRNLAVKNTELFHERSREDGNGLLIEERTFESTLNNVQLFESAILLSYQLRELNFPISNIFAGVRPLLLNAPEASSGQSFAVGASPEPVIPWDIDDDYREGFSKFDMGIVFGFEIPIGKRIYLDTRVNMNFKDITDDTHWNVDPKKNTFSDVQLTLRWDIFNF